MAKALLYATVGILAAQAALGRGGRTTDLGGALREVVRAPDGRSPAAGDREWGSPATQSGESWTRSPTRRARGATRKGSLAGSAVRRAGLGHGALAVAAFGLATGSSDGGGGDKRELASRAVDVAGGSWLLWVAAAAVLGYACYQLYRAYAAKLGSQLDLGAVSMGVGRWVIGLSRVGHRRPRNRVRTGRRAAGACGAARESSRGRRNPRLAPDAGGDGALAACRSSHSAWWHTPSTSCSTHAIAASAPRNPRHVAWASGVGGTEARRLRARHACLGSYDRWGCGVP